MGPLPSALIFPETEPSVHDIGRFLFFFNTLSYYLPTESENTDNISRGLFENFCTGYAPAPLHNDLDRFKALLREMENSRPEDMARLFASAQSPVTTGQIRDKDESSAGTVLSALQEDSVHKAEVLYKERLWQARLVLKLAEMLDRREKEVRQGLDRIINDEKKIFASLDGLNATGPVSVKNQGDYSDSGSPLLAPIRAKAWAELFLADSSTSRPLIIATACPDCASLLLDGYENVWNKTPQKLISLSIPEFSHPKPDQAEMEKYISARNKLRGAIGESLEYYAGIFSEAAEKQEQVSVEQKHFEAWEETIKTEFPSPAREYQKLDFYCFPGISTQNLFRKIFHLEPVVDVKEPGNITSILAILH